MKKLLFGIDYGSKYSGTTVICYNDFREVCFLESSRNSDADAFIVSEAVHLKPEIVFMDAPLSLPGIYSIGNGYRDHFFRKCDREMNAMSPMFLGGLTARAMKLKADLKSVGCKIRETYPRKLIQVLKLPDDHYRKSKEDIEPFAAALIGRLNISINTNAIRSWHHVDALLAFLSGMRYMNREHLVFGRRKEGLVYV